MNKKVIILGDVHFGKSKGSPDFFNNQVLFFEKQLIPYMLENKIDTIFQLGDFLDNRKTLDGYIYHNMIKLFEKFRDLNLKIIFPLGNHDIYFRESLEVNLIDIFGRIFPDTIEIVKEEKVFEINSKKILFVPWLVHGAKLNVQSKNVDVILGHFEIKNFEVVKGIESKHGLDSTDFENKKVYSGHYHNLQRKDTILYVGTPFQFDWSDYKERKGFWITDFCDYEEFIDNKISLKHLKIIFDDVNLTDNLYPISIHGFEDNILGTTVNFFIENAEKFANHKIKFIINNSTSGDHMKCINHLKSIQNLDFSVINNFQVSKIINTDYASSFVEDIEIKDSYVENDTHSIIRTACIENNVQHVLEEVINIKNQK